MQIREYLYPVLLFITSFIFYGNSIKNNYSLDDDIVILNNENIKKGIAGIPKIFSSHYQVNKEQKYEYRPLVLASFAIEYHFFGKNPAASHFINILIYALTCILLFFLLKNLFLSAHPAFIFFVILLFLAHPVHTEVVNNLKCRDELLYFFLALLANLFAIRHIDTRKFFYLVGSIFLLFLAIISKKSAVVFILVIPLSLYFFREFPLKKTFIFSFMFFLALIGVFMLRRFLLEDPSIRKIEFYENPLFYLPASDRIPASLYILLYYLKLLIIPHPLSFYYGFDYVKIAGWKDWEVYLFLFIYCAAFIYILKNFRKKSIEVFAVLFFMISIFPFSNLVKPVVGIVAERFAYAPSLGFSLLLISLLWNFLKLKDINHSRFPKKILYVLLPVLAICFIRVYNRNKNWKDLLTLLRADNPHLTRSYNAHALLATTALSNIEMASSAFEKETLSREAESHFNAAISIYPRDYKIFNNLGILYLKHLKNYKLSEEMFLKAIQKDSTQYITYMNLGKNYYMQGLPPEKTDSCYSIAFDLSNNNVEVFIDYITFSLSSSRIKDAEFIFEKAIVLFPHEKKLYLLCAQINALRMDVFQTISCYETYLKYDRCNPEIRKTLSMLYLSVGDRTKADYYNKKCRDL